MPHNEQPQSSMPKVSIESNLAATYKRRFEHVSEYRRRVWTVLVRDVFQQFIPAEGEVLDLGCGWGEFINQIHARRRFGMDANPESAARLDAGVTFLHQNCADEWQVAAGSLDAVFTSNFFEHLPDKRSLTTTLSEAHRSLRSGGHLVCLGPNIKYVPGEYWDFWDHHLPLTELSLKEAIELSGFRVERCIGRFLPYTMATGIQWPIWIVSLYVRLPFLWRFVGKQFLVVAFKP